MSDLVAVDVVVSGSAQLTDELNERLLETAITPTTTCRFTSVIAPAL